MFARRFMLSPHIRRWFVTHIVAAAMMLFIIAFADAAKPGWLLQAIWGVYGAAVGFDLNSAIIKTIIKAKGTGTAAEAER